MTPWAVDLSFADLESTGFKGVLGGLFGGGGGKKDGDDSGPTLQTAGAVFKEVPLYGENTPLPLKKTLSITRSENFEVREVCRRDERWMALSGISCSYGLKQGRDCWVGPSAALIERWDNVMEIMHKSPPDCL